MFRCKQVLKVVFCKVNVFTLHSSFRIRVHLFQYGDRRRVVVLCILCILPGVKSVLSVLLICFDFDVNIITLLYIYISD